MTDMRVNESGKRFRVNFAFDMSSNTALEFAFLKPVSGTTLTVNATLGTTSTIINGVTANANTWVYYDFAPGDIDEVGNYDVQFTYTNTSATPDDIFKNNSTITLTVNE